MRKVYLVRHGAVKFDNDVKRCIGITDVALSDEGIKQCERLRDYFKDKNIEKIYCSDLNRSIHSANLISNDQIAMEIDPDFKEMDMGSFENVELTKIHKTLEWVSPDGETREHALERFIRAFNKALASSTNDIIITSHAGIMCCFLAYLTHVDLKVSRGIDQAYACINTLIIDKDIKVESLNVKCEGYVLDDDIKRLYQKYKLDEHIIKHCQKVNEVALSIANKLINKGYEVDINVLKSACLLHDIMRKEKDHAYMGYKVLKKEGYLGVAEIIRYHHDISDDTSIEAKILYLADKLVKEDQLVSIEERFSESKKKCQNEEAIKAFEKRYQMTLRIEKEIKDMMGEEL